MRILLLGLILLFSAAFGFLFYMGMLSNYEIQKREIGPFNYVYEPYVGPYPETGKVGMEIYNSLKDDGIDSEIGLGIYFDNPEVTPSNQLRSEMGSVLTDSDYEKLPSFADKYDYKIVPKTNSLVVEFPIRNFLSYMMGPMKVYPLMESYMEKNGYVVTEEDVGIEIYDMEKNVIIYALPLN